MITQEEIKKIREELARITKWPWRCDEYRHNDDNSFMWWQIHKGTTSDYGGDDCVANTWLNVASVEEKEGLHDAIFIAKSPERIAALLDEVERLKKPGDCPFCQGTGAWEHKHSHELLRDLRAKLKVAEDALERVERWSFSWDGDCGVCLFASETLEKIREA